MAAIFGSLLDKKLVEQIKNGAVGILPTDTVYGIVCQASNQTAVERLFILKKREHKPGTIIAANIEQVVSLGFKRAYLKAVEQFWPGAISVVIPSADESTAYLRQGLTSLPVRIPKNSKLIALLNKTGPLLTTSANPPGKEPANNIEQAGLYFGDKIDFYVDGGDLKNRQPSTIIRVVDDEIEVLRQGSIKIQNNQIL